MTRIESLIPEFVEFMPDELQEGVLYDSIPYKSMQHLCCCGYRRKVVTPLSPTGWRMAYDGRTISVWPSIGNWQKECGSHYIIEETRVEWARRWSKKEIAAGFKRDRRIKQEYYGESTRSEGGVPNERTSRSEEQPKKRRRRR